MICYWDKIDSPMGAVYLAATDEGLIYCSTPNGTEEELQKWAVKHLPDCTLQRGTNSIIGMANGRHLPLYLTVKPVPTGRLQHRSAAQKDPGL